MATKRLDKIISESSSVTRSEARKLIRLGRVRVGGEVVTKAESKVAENAEIRLDGKLINCGKFRYIMLNKPAGVLSATKDKDQETVLSLLPPEFALMKLFPVGRLDKDTTGLIILTNDGAYCHDVISPKHGVVKLYEAFVDGELSQDDADAFQNGITLKDGTKCLPAVLKLDDRDLSRAEISITEGKYHQVKRMLASRGKPVLKLKRLAIGSLNLDVSLNPGEYRELKKEEAMLVFEKDFTKK